MAHFLGRINFTSYSWDKCNFFNILINNEKQKIQGLRLPKTILYGFYHFTWFLIKIIHCIDQI